MRENRWFTKQGRAKRVSAEVIPFKYFMHKRKSLILENRSIQLIRDIRIEYNLTLVDAVNLYVFLNGLYNNPDSLFTNERFSAGKVVASQINQFQPKGSIK
jgi:hypothetical protein